MNFTQVCRYAEKGEKDAGRTEKEKKEFCESLQQKMKVDNAINDRRTQITGAAGGAFQKAQGMISRAPQLQQFIIGGATGWATGFVTKRVGSTAAIICGGSALLIVGANQAGFININWNKFGKKMEQTGGRLESKIPALKGNIGKYARANTYFAAGFVGGFLLGIAS